MTLASAAPPLTRAMACSLLLSSLLGVGACASTPYPKGQVDELHLGAGRLRIQLTKAKVSLAQIELRSLGVVRDPAQMEKARTEADLKQARQLESDLHALPPTVNSLLEEAQRLLTETPKKYTGEQEAHLSTKLGYLEESISWLRDMPKQIQALVNLDESLIRCLTGLLQGQGTAGCSGDATPPNEALETLAMPEGIPEEQGSGSGDTDGVVEIQVPAPPPAPRTRTGFWQNRDLIKPEDQSGAAPLDGVGAPVGEIEVPMDPQAHLPGSADYRYYDSGGLVGVGALGDPKEESGDGLTDEEETASTPDYRGVLPGSQDVAPALGHYGKRRGTFITWLGYEPAADRVFVQLTKPTEYTVEKGSDGRIYLEFPKSGIATTNNARALDMSHFPTAVKRVWAKRVRGGATRVTLTLKRYAPFTVRRRGRYVYVQFR